jgi:predicted  nucleic acid-binding Zn-ribbon protein
MIVNLKIKIEEAKRTEEVLRSQLEEREKKIERMEEEIVSLRKDLQKKDMQQNTPKFWMRSSTVKIHTMTGPG